MSLTRIAVDAMGGDHGLRSVLPAARLVLTQHQQVELILVGPKDVLSQAMAEDAGPHDARLRLHHASEIVSMDEDPVLALRRKKDSSMRVAINLVHRGDADACVSAGNTGALMATARYVLKTLPGIDRPAIVYALPTRDGSTHMLDLGANVDSTPEQLLQFAVMGSEMLTASLGRAATVGLLNIGSESIKGNAQVREAHKLLIQAQDNGLLDYQGYIEGDDVYRGTVDVVVCDGFVGNVALKTSEGLASMISDLMHEVFARNWLTRVMGLLAMPCLRALKQRLDPRRYNGASLLGLNGVVIKSHGSADAFAFSHAILEAMEEARRDIPGSIRERLARAVHDCPQEQGLAQK